MGAILKLLTGTSQGATPVQDGGTRAAYVAVLNGLLLVGCHLVHITNADTLVIVALANPLVVIGFSVWDSIDRRLQAQRGVETAPTVIKKNTELADA